jgi:hypothetical protein
MFYCEKYNEENVAELTKRIDEMKDVEFVIWKIMLDWQHSFPAENYGKLGYLEEVKVVTRFP